VFNYRYDNVRIISPWRMEYLRRIGGCGKWIYASMLWWKWLPASWNTSVQFPAKARKFLLGPKSRIPHQSTYRRVSDQSMKLSTYFHLVPKVLMFGNLIPHFCTTLWQSDSAQGKFIFTSTERCNNWEAFSWRHFLHIITTMAAHLPLRVEWPQRRPFSHTSLFTAPIGPNRFPLPVPLFKRPSPPGAALLNHTPHTTWAHLSLLIYTSKMPSKISSETLISIYKTTRCQKREHQILKLCLWTDRACSTNGGEEECI
jgi:hypothetical protein